MRKLRLGCVGLTRGNSLFRLAGYDPRVELVAACDLQIDVWMRRLGPEYEAAGIRLEKTYDNFDQFLEHTMDAVLIATPPPFHARQSIAALNAGMHVLCEIPTAMNLEEAHELVNAARRTDRLYMAAENLRYLGMTHAWREIVQNGKLGKVIYGEGEYVHDIRELHSDTWTDSYYPNAPLDKPTAPSWRASLHPIRYCTHEVGPLLEILEDRVVQVMAVDTGSNLAPETGTIDMAVALMKTAKGTLLKELVGFCVAQPSTLRYFCLYGTKGSLETTRWAGEETLAYFEDIPNLTGMMKLPIAAYPKGRYPRWVTQSGHGGVDGVMMFDFLNCIIENRPSPADVYRGLDFTLPGILGVMSAEGDNGWLDVPDPREW